jgi:hypothetical protein
MPDEPVTERLDGAATSIAAQLVSQSQALLEAAQSPFIQGMSDAVQVGGVAAFTALLLFLPAVARSERRFERASSRSRQQG